MAMKSWKIDAAHSGIHFSVRHLVFAKVRGRFGEFEGSVHFDADNLAALKAEVEINAASIDTGVADRDKHLRSADFFDVEKFPKLSFVSEQAVIKTPTSWQVPGQLSLHGVTRPVTLDVEFGGEATDLWGNRRIACTAKTSLLRADFGLVWNQALEAGGVLVGERIDVELEIQAVAIA